ncbi:MAG: hypothetical protein A2161_16750, partial [Candidatus Schekmanbacteria bacterium RBG_13_48_7]
MKSKQMPALRKFAVFLIPVFIFIITVLLFSPNLSTSSRLQTDENLYIEACLEMLNSKNYLVPVFEGKLRFQKPILFYWFVLSFYKIFGISIFSARLVSVFAGAVTTAATYLFSRRIFSPKVAVSSALLLSGNYIYFIYCRAAQTDVVLTMFTTLSLVLFGIGYFETKGRRKYLFLSFMFAGLAFSVKGGVALLLTIWPIILFCLINHDFKFLKNVFRIENTAIFIILSLWHYIFLLFLFKQQFLHHLLVKEVSDRISWSLIQTFHHFIFYLKNLLVSSFPFSLLPFLLYFMIPGKRFVIEISQYKKKETFLFIIILSISFVFIIFVSKSAQRYIIPAIPFFSILISNSYYCFTPRSSSIDKLQAIFSIIFLVALVIFMGITVLFFSQSLIPTWMLSISILLTLFTTISVYRWTKDYKLFPLVILCSVLLVTYAETLARPYFQMEREKNLIEGFDFHNKEIYYYQLGKSTRLIINLGTLETHNQIELDGLLNLINYQAYSPNKRDCVVLTKTSYDSFPLNMQQHLKIERKAFRYNWKDIKYSQKELFDGEKLNTLLINSRDWLYLVFVLPDKKTLK